MQDRQELGREHSKKDKEVFDFFREVMNAVSSAFVTHNNGNSYVEPRAQTILLFSFVDVCASYWYEYSNITDTPKKRFIAWFESYCLNKRNKYYLGTDFAKVPASRFYDFRSSLVHFFGLAAVDPNDSEEYSYMLVPNNAVKSKIQKLREGFRKRGRKVIIFSPVQLRRLVFQGALVMLDEWKQVINQAQMNEQKKWAHIEGIDRIYKKFYSEGAKTLQLPQQTNKSDSAGSK